MLAIRSARLWPGSGSTLVSPALVIVDRGRVVDVDGTGAEPPPHAETVDLGDVTLLPGLVDAHVHLAFDAGNDIPSALQSTDDATLLQSMEDNARKHLAAGITTVRDLGDRGYLGLALRDRFRADPATGPELLVAGPPITRRHGHCWFLGGEADGLEELHDAVAERSGRGCDVVKIMATGGVLTPGFGPHESQYGREELGTVVAAAHSLGLPVTAHAHGRSGVADSVEAGVDGIEHCTFLTPAGVDIDWDVVDRAAARGTFAGLTLSLAPGIPAPPALARVFEQLYGQVSRLHQAGLRIVCSSDAGVAPPKPHGVLPHGAVQLSRVGLTNVEALETVTGLAAQSCGLGRRKGRVVPGFDADIVAVEGNPLADISSLLRVAAVFRAGVRARTTH